MKRLLVLALISTLFNALALETGFAAAEGGSNSLRRKAPPTYNYDPDAYVSDARPAYMIQGFNMGFEYMSTSRYERDVKNKTTGDTQKGLLDDAAKEPKQLGIKFGYKQIPSGGVGFDMNLSVLKPEKRSDNAPEITTAIPNLNFIVAAPDYVYASFGLNTSFVLGASDDVTYSPRVGYQAGLGVIMGSRFSLEVFYNWIRLGMETDKDMTEVRTTATNARLIYAF